MMRSVFRSAEDLSMNIADNGNSTSLPDRNKQAIEFADKSEHKPYSAAFCSVVDLRAVSDAFRSGFEIHPFAMNTDGGLAASVVASFAVVNRPV